ncbi:MAG: hypothetical protein ANABAC_0215 [Anaerolineae bacterium]|nr:MAG: hypothetical protein ANABAC_0215 [Anaerolineae bacterium]
MLDQQINIRVRDDDVVYGGNPIKVIKGKFKWHGWFIER